MHENYQIVSVEKPEWGIIGGGIHNYNIQQAGEDHGQTMCFVIQGPDEEVVGGVIAATHWDWFYIDLIWIKEELADDTARQLGARNAYLDTFSFQALDFYKKYGYQVFGELKDFPVGHQRYYLTKQL